MTLTYEQRKALENLWFEYGNNGPKHTWGNHKFIQGMLERGEDDRDFFRKTGRLKEWKPLSPECEAAVDAILTPKKS